MFLELRNSEMLYLTVPTCLQKQGRETRVNVRKKIFDPSLVENNMTLDI